MPELLRVIPVGRVVPEHSGGVIVVASVELWSDALVLRTAEVTPPPSPARPQARGGFWPPEFVVDWQVSDDLGNQYELSGGPTGGAPGRIFGTVVCRPPAAVNATRLHIFAPQMAVEVPLDVRLSH
jgi:hypothetical protein